MGLDMYLEKKMYIGGTWNNRESQRVKVKDYTGKEVEFDLKNVKELVFDAGYWRKANAIHNWFVKNIQNDNDDCGEYYVSKEKLQELLNTVDSVLEASELVDGKIANGYNITEKGKEPIVVEGKYIKNPEVAHKLLPTVDGFFFGSRNYDQFYYDDLLDTKNILEEALKSDDSYYYSSSW